MRQRVRSTGVWEERAMKSGGGGGGWGGGGGERRTESEDGVCVGWGMRGETVGEGGGDRNLLYEYGGLRGRA